MPIDGAVCSGRVLAWPSVMRFSGLEPFTAAA
jgi:hypothetical protein